MYRPILKNSLILLLILPFIIFSCQKETLNSDSTTDITDITDLLKIASASSLKCGHADSTDSLHREKHHRLDITEIDISILSSTISSYIAANYAGSTVEKAGVDSLGNIYIKLKVVDSSFIGLLFDANGVFVKELVKQAKGKKGSEVAISSLPASISTYTNSNYVGATIHKAFVEPDGTYQVLLILSDGTYLGLSFDASGNFISTITIKDKHGKKKRKK